MPGIWSNLPQVRVGADGRARARRNRTLGPARTVQLSLTRPGPERAPGPPTVGRRFTSALSGRDIAPNSHARQARPEGNARLGSPLRVEEERRQGSTVSRQPRREQSAMLGHPPPARPRVANNQPRVHGSGRPAATCRNSSCKPSLPVERADEFVHIDDGRLELDHHERTGGLVPGKEIDHASLAVDGEGDFRDRHPTGLASDPGRNSLAQCSMPCAHDAVEFAAGRSRDEFQADAELRRDSAKRAQRRSIDVAMLQTRHERGRDSRLHRKIALTQTTLDASRPERQAELKIVHDRQDEPGLSSRACLARSQPLSAAKRCRARHSLLRDRPRQLREKVLLACLRGE